MRFLRRVLPYVMAFVVLLLAFEAVGAAMDPGWQPETYTDHIVVADADTKTQAAGTTDTPEGTYQVRSTTTRVKLAPHVSVDAIVREPVGAPTGRPACLFIHGAGTGKASEVYADLANAMSSAGIVTLVPSKRLDTYSALRRNYFSMAHDYEASLKVLRDWPGVDAHKAGIYAESEGTWISEAIAGDDPSVAFMILTSPPALSGRHQMAMAINSYMALSGAPEGLTRTANKVISMDFAPLGPNYADFPAERLLSNLTMPLLVNYGTADPSMPIEQGARLILDKTRKAGNVNVTVRYYNANHQMRQGAETSKPGLPLDPNYTHNLEGWTWAIASGATADSWTTPMIAGSQPNQRFSAPLHTPSGIVTSLNALVALIALALICFIGAAVIRTVTALAHGRRKQSIRPWPGDQHGLPRSVKTPLALTGIALLLTASAFFAYAGTAVSTALNLTANATFLRVGWIALHVAALLDIALAAWVMVALIRSWQERRQRLSSPTPSGRETTITTWGAARTAIVILMVVGCVAFLALLAFFGLFGL